jgi:hypothetical protein
MAALRHAAEQWPGKNLSTLAERLISDGLRKLEDDKRDPALRGLLVLIAQLAERLAGAKYMPPDAKLRSRYQREWRTELFNFRAFKFAVAKLLDALEEPPPPEFELDKEGLEEIKEESEKIFGPEWTKTFLAINSTPESSGAFAFNIVWELANRESPLTESELAMGSKDPYFGKIIEQDFHALPSALKALKLPTERERRRQTLRDFEKAWGPESDRAKKYRRRARGTRKAAGAGN